MKYPIYCIHGDDVCLIDDTVMQTEQMLHEKGFGKRELFLVENTFDWIHFSQQLFHASLFDENRLIQLRFLSTKFPTAAVQCLLNYLKHPQTDIALILVMPKLDARIQQSNWFKTLAHLGKVIPTYAFSSKRFADWIRMQATRLNITLSLEAISLLCETTENNTLAAQQYLAYAALSFQQSHLTENELLSLMTDQSQYSIFSLIDAIQQKEIATIDHIVTRLKETQIEPTLVLWGLIKIIREKNISKAKKVAAQIDKAIKGFSIGEPWQALHALSLRLGATS